MAGFVKRFSEKIPDFFHYTSDLVPSVGLYLSLLALCLPHHSAVRSAHFANILGQWVLVSIRRCFRFHQFVGEYLGVFPS